MGIVAAYCTRCHAVPENVFTSFEMIQHMKKDTNGMQDQRQKDKVAWKKLVAEYEKPSRWKSNWQLVNSLVPFVALWCLMYFTRDVSFWLTFALALLTGAFVVRIFIISHDCGHGSFFRSRKANDFWGFITGVPAFTPYYLWRWEHAVHHATAGDLDRRGKGDVWTWTPEEYLGQSRVMKAVYRLIRSPLAMFTISPFLLFVIRQRFEWVKAGDRERRSVYWTNLAILAMAVALSVVFGVKHYLMIQAVVIWVAGCAGIWLFYVQHQFEDVYWERHDKWDYVEAALRGSSYYKLPRVLQWFSGNIGFHHVHHLSPAIPNYNLEKCHNSHPLFRNVKPITLFSSIKCMFLNLYDEPNKRLISFGEMKQN